MKINHSLILEAIYLMDKFGLEIFLKVWSNKKRTSGPDLKYDVTINLRGTDGSLYKALITLTFL